MTDSPSDGDGTGAVADTEFGWRGRAVVAMVVVAFLIAPGALLVLPTVQGAVSTLGLSLRDAYLTLPMAPALALAVVAVWSAVRARAGQE